jgi:MscS family membrane protein
MDYLAVLNTVRQWTGLNEWIVQVFLVVFFTLLADFLQRRLLARLLRRLRQTDNDWDDALVEAMRRPLTVLIWVVGLTFAAEIVQQETDAAIFQAVKPIQDIGVIGALAWFLVRFTSNAQANLVAQGLARDPAYDRTTADAVGKLIRLSIIITASLVGLQTLGYSVSGVLAFGGIGGIAVGFAAKDLLANFFGGLMIYLDRPFSVGDWIRSSDREIEGTVEAIGWRLTQIRTFDKRPLYVPNSLFTSITVENPSRMSHRRIRETIGIRYEDVGKMAPITRDVETMLREHSEIDDSQTLMVHFNTFAPSSLDFFIYTFTKTTVWTEYHRVKQDVLLRVHEIIARHGAQVAFPTSTIHLGEEIAVDWRGAEPATRDGIA